MENKIMNIDEVIVRLTERATLVKHMKPYLKMFLMIEYMNDKRLTRNYCKELFWKLKEFHNKNPAYFVITRLLYRSNSFKKTELRVVSTPDYIHFPKNRTCDFHTTHIYEDTKYNSFIYRGYYTANNEYPDESIAYRLEEDYAFEQTVRYINEPVQNNHDDTDEDETIVYNTDEDEDDDI
jgi:hypothetical protein